MARHQSVVDRAVAESMARLMDTLGLKACTSCRETITGIPAELCIEAPDADGVRDGWVLCASCFNRGNVGAWEYQYHSDGRVTKTA